jgi:hypothetical protein
MSSLIDSSNAFVAELAVQAKDNDWVLVTTGFSFYNGAFLIKNCKRTTEAEMVYYNFDLLRDTTHIKLFVNYRHHPEDSAALTSVFSFSGDGYMKEEVLLAEKPMARRFTKSILQYID